MITIIDYQYDWENTQRKTLTLKIWSQEKLNIYSENKFKKLQVLWTECNKIYWEKLKMF